MHEMDGPRFFRFVTRLHTYGGAVAATFKRLAAEHAPAAAEAQPTAPAAPRIPEATPASVSVDPHIAELFSFGGM